MVFQTVKIKTFFMKSIFFVAFILTAIALFGCKKENAMTQVKIQIDYLGAGGYYNDNISGVPSGLSLGSNGPYPADPGQTYTVTYKADDNFPVITKMFTPTSGLWTIHCYVVANTEYITTMPGN